MGIPRFFRLILEQFPTVVERTSFKEGFSKNASSPVDNLYLDANGILHNCAREIYFPAPTKPRLSRRVAAQPTPAPTAEQLERKLFKAITDYMDQLLKFVKPKKLFYIAIDGPAPMAKQAQQRQRRYKAAEEKTDEEIKIFDSTAITPGTIFMYKLSQFIRFYIRKMLSTDPMWQKINVIFSGPDTVGEGEHKIIEYVRNAKDKYNLVHCMYGLDADLFMLGLGTHCPKFYLLREDQFNTIWGDTLFYKVSLGVLRNEIFNHWGSVGGNVDKLINDFIFVCFMVGNDFLHALPECHDLVDSISFIMDLRKEVLKSSYITNDDISYNLNNLTLLLSHLAITEPQAIAGQYYRSNFPNITLNSSLKDPEHPDQGIDIEKYRKLYYKKVGVDHKDKRAVWNYCKQYLQGLEWVHYYYHNWPKNWQWFFPYHYSPLSIDLVEYLTNASTGSRLTRVSNKYLEPILPFQQLLCVVPPRSKHLLPKFLQQLYHCKELKKYYPDTFKLDYEGKIREWEAIALLPFIQLEDVVIAYKDAEKSAANKKIRTRFARNHLGKATLFYYSKRECYTYKSDYGHIKDCPVAFKSVD